MILSFTAVKMDESQLLLDSSESESNVEQIDPLELVDLNRSNVYEKALRYEEVIISGTIFYKSDFERLLPRNWLNDKIINYYFELLGKHYKNTYYFSTFTYSIVLKKPIESWEYHYGEEDFSKYTSFFIPIHTHSHWSLVKMQDNLLLGFDSLGEVPSDILCRIKDFYSLMILNKDQSMYKFYSKRTNGIIPKQTNGDDCGVFCCAYAKYYSQERYIQNTKVICAFDSSEILRIRREILVEILSGRIIYE